MVGAGLLGYHVLTSNDSWKGGGIMPAWVAEAQVGVGWELS